MFKRFTVGFAAGYVLGARAGRDRYEKIVEVAQRLEDVPVVGIVTDRGREFASDGGQRVVESLRDRLPSVSSLWSGGNARSSDDSGDEDEPEDEYEDEQDAGGEYDDEQDEQDDYDDEQDDEDDEGEEDQDGGDEDQQPARARRQNGSDNGRGSRASDRRPARSGRSGGRRSDRPAKGGSSSRATKTKSSRSRGGLSGVVAAARERGRVD